MFNPSESSLLPAACLPIRVLGHSHRPRILEHMLRLNPADRYLRFGYTASDAQIERYVQGLNMESDDLLGIFNRRLELLGVAHVAYMTSGHGRRMAEFGVSVATHARGRGYGAHLFERASVLARNRKVETLYIHALTENAAMLHIARKAGAVLERSGSETEAYLRLPPSGPESRLAELVQDQIAQTDYHFKQQALGFRHWINGMLGQGAAAR